MSLYNANIHNGIQLRATKQLVSQRLSTAVVHDFATPMLKQISQNT